MEFLHGHPWISVYDPTMSAGVIAHDHVVIDRDDWLAARNLAGVLDAVRKERDYLEAEVRAIHGSYCVPHGGTGDGSRCIRCRDEQIVSLLAELKEISDALGTSDWHSSVDHIKRLMEDRIDDREETRI